MKTHEEQIAFANELSLLTEEFEWLSQLTPTDVTMHELEIILHKMDELRNNYLK